MTLEGWTEDQWAAVAPCPTCAARSGAQCEGGSTHPARAALAGSIKAMTMFDAERRGVCDCCGQALP
jgi:hypothetical protein